MVLIQAIDYLIQNKTHPHNPQKKKKWEEAKKRFAQQNFIASGEKRAHNVSIKGRVFRIFVNQKCLERLCFPSRFIYTPVILKCHE